MLPNILWVDVTAEDIALGDEGDPWSCPVARALLRLPDICDAEVIDGNGIRVSLNDGSSLRYTGSKAVSRFIDSFDKGRRNRLTPKRFRLVSSL